MTDRELLKAIKEKLEIAHQPNLSPIEEFGGQTQEGRLRRQATMAEAAIFALGMLEGHLLDEDASEEPDRFCFFCGSTEDPLCVEMCLCCGGARL